MQMATTRKIAQDRHIKTAYAVSCGVESKESAKTSFEKQKQESTLLANALYGDFGLPFGTGKAITLDDMILARDDAMFQVQQNLDYHLAMAGVFVEHKANLRVTSNGGIKVFGNHPNKPAIEKVFAKNEDIASKFREMSGLASLVRAGKMHTKYMTAYERNPQMAEALRQQIEYVSKYSVFSAEYSAGNFEGSFT